MDGIVFFRGVGAGQLEDDLAASWMLRQEGCHIVHIAVQSHPTALFRAMLLDVLVGECLAHGWGSSRG